MQHISVNRNRQTVVSYPVSSCIQVLGLDGQNPIEHEAQSRYFKGPTEPVQNGTDGRIHFLRQNAYGTIYYDPYRDVYYRFASQAIRDELPKPAGPIVPATFMPTSVIILDKDFNKIEEMLLPMKKSIIIITRLSAKTVPISQIAIQTIRLTRKTKYRLPVINWSSNSCYI